MQTEQARATAKAIWRLAKVDGYQPYQPYGYDWPTLRLTHPQLATTLRACYAVPGVL